MTGPGRRGLVAAAVVLVVALVMGLVAVLGASDGSPGDGSATADVRAVARDKAVRAVLSRRAHAVLHRDEKAWLADIDPQAHEFLSAQRTVFASLAQVDFASWRYELVGRDYDRPDLADSYDVPYHLPAVLRTTPSRATTRVRSRGRRP